MFEIRIISTNLVRSFERGELGFRDLFVPGDAQVSFDNVAYTMRFMIDHEVRAFLLTLDCRHELDPSQSWSLYGAGAERVPFAMPN